MSDNQELEKNLWAAADKMRNMMKKLTKELKEQMQKAGTLEAEIKKNLSKIGYKL